MTRNAPQSDAVRTKLGGLPWTSEEVERRLIEATDTLRRLPGGVPRSFKGHGASWQDVRRHFQTDYADEETAAVSLPPEPSAIDRYLDTLAWLRFLLDDHVPSNGRLSDQRLVFLGALVQRGERQARIPWREVRRLARYWREPPYTMKRRYLRGLQQIAVHVTNLSPLVKILT